MNSTRCVGFADLAKRARLWAALGSGHSGIFREQFLATVEGIEADGIEAVAANVTKGLQEVLRLMQTKAPDAVVVVTAIFPRNDNMAVMPAIDQINANLAKMADGRKIRYLNVNRQLADADNKLYDGMMNPDKLHPAEKGYQVWADGLKPIFTELLGPPSTTDHAPPPTGDPSAAKGH